MAPSIFAVHNDRVLLSHEATNGVFAEGVRAQLGFTAIDEPPFSGRKGRMLLAVVDGVVDEHAIQVLVARRLTTPMTVVAKAHTDGAPILLKELSSHSILRKAPAGLLRRSGSWTMTWLERDPALLAQIAGRLDLRDPNRRAISAVVDAVADGDGTEVVCDLATGVGKT